LLEQVGVEVEVLEMHLRVEQVFLVHVDVDHLVPTLDRLGQEVLDRVDLVVDVVLLALHVAGEAADAVVHHHDVRLEALDQVVQGLQRRDHATRGHVDVGAEGGDAVVRVRFRIGVHGDVRLVQVRHHGVGDDLLAGLLLVDHRLLGDEDRSEEHTSELQSREKLVCRHLLEKKNVTVEKSKPVSVNIATTANPTVEVTEKLGSHNNINVNANASNDTIITKSASAVVIDKKGC